MLMTFAMKTPGTFPRAQIVSEAKERFALRRVRFGTGNGFGFRAFGFLAWLILLVVWGSTAFGANSFVVGFQGIDVVDTAVDNSGITYVLGKDATNNTVLRKYDASGAVLLWTGDLAVYRTNSTLK